MAEHTRQVEDLADAARELTFQIIAAAPLAAIEDMADALRNQTRGAKILMLGNLARRLASQEDGVQFLWDAGRSLLWERL